MAGTITREHLLTFMSLCGKEVFSLNLLQSITSQIILKRQQHSTLPPL